MFLRLHSKYGVNPTIACCYLCGKEKNELALLGAGYKGEAPKYMIIDYIPCDWCKDNMKQGIVIVQATNSNPPTRTGPYIVLRENALPHFLKEPLLSKVLTNRVCYMDKQMWEQLAFPSK